MYWFEATDDTIVHKYRCRSQPGTYEEAFTLPAGFDGCLFFGDSTECYSILYVPSSSSSASSISVKASHPLEVLFSQKGCITERDFEVELLISGNQAKRQLWKNFFMNSSSQQPCDRTRAWGKFQLAPRGRSDSSLTDSSLPPLTDRSESSDSV